MSRNLLLILIVIIGIVMLLSLASWLTEKFTPQAKQINYGVTFSPKYATELGLNWQQIYQKILTELKVKYLRIPSYWDLMEKNEGKIDFTGVDYMLDQAQKNKAEIILTVGIKQPRWPECHTPEWTLNLDSEVRQQKLMNFVSQVVKRYKDHPALQAWQVENEPFWAFGADCETLDKQTLLSEIALVKKLDPTHPIILTDSGEAPKLPISIMKYSDLFGTTLYRTVHVPGLGFIQQPYLPGYYTLKSKLTKLLFAPNNQKTIVIELQTEPWSPDPLTKTPIAKQLRIFSPEKMRENIDFANRTGFDQIYLWGVEWWYWMESKGRPDYLKIATSLF